jgi:hypothetical protein
VAHQREEDFRPSGGRVLGVLGLAGLGVVAGVSVVDPAVGLPAWAYSSMVLVAVLVWAALLRPRVWVGGGDLVLRTMFETVHLPLAAVETLAVRQLLVVGVGGRRYTCAALGRSRRTLVRSGAPGGGGALGVGSLLGFGGRNDAVLADHPPPRALGVDYTDFVESRLLELTTRARLEARVRRGSPEQRELATGVRRRPAWPEIGGLSASAALTVALALL